MFIWVGNFISFGCCVKEDCRHAIFRGFQKTRLFYPLARVIACVIIFALPGWLFYTTQIPVCLWFVARNKKNGNFRNRRNHTLFIDARKLGALIDRTHKDFSDEEIDKVAMTYHAWRGEKDAGEYKDVPGFCKSASTDEIKEHG